MVTVIFQNCVVVRDMFILWYKSLCTLPNKTFGDGCKFFLSPSFLRKLSRDDHTKIIKARSS